MNTKITHAFSQNITMRNQTLKSAPYIVVDWGTTNLRVWLIGCNGEVIDARQSTKGMGTLRGDQFETAFLDLSEDHLNENTITQVLICGMAGSLEGWAAAGYLETPCVPVDAKQSIIVPTIDARIYVRIIPGIKQIDPPDVMRGEETQIAGYLAHNVNFNGVICLPGTHSKWVNIEGGKVKNFQTYMTGELFSLLSNASVLRHVVAQDGWDKEAFAQGLNMELTRPGLPVAQLFYLRAEALIAKLSPVEARSRLSGHLIGAELTAAKTFWCGRKIVIIGEPSVARAYKDALKILKVNAEQMDGNNMTLAGLLSALRNYENTYN